MPIYKSKQNPDINSNNEIQYYPADLQPILKWVGGKTQILTPLIDKFPKTIKGNYYEMFAGGGSVFLELIKRIKQNKLKLNGGNIYVNDINSNLINLYQHIKDKPYDLINKIEQFKKEYHDIEDLKEEDEYNENGKKKRKDTKKFDDYDEDDVDTKEAYYYVKRCRYNKIKNDDNKKLERAALFVFLNKTCWRGVYRENSTGVFNVPFGNHNTVSIYSERQIKSLNHCFNNNDFKIEFYNEDFRQFIKKIKKDDFVYMDPPYFPNTLQFECRPNYLFLKRKDNIDGIFKFKKKGVIYKLDENNEPIPTGKSKKVFATYNKESFGLKEQTELLEICKKFKKQKTKFILSNSCSQWILNEYINFNIEKIQCKRRINSKKPQDTDFEVFIN